jgi:NADPH-dependent ferric siderophore reductase
VHLEVADADDEIELPSPRRPPSPGITGGPRRLGREPDEAARTAEVADGTKIWVACEALRCAASAATPERRLPASSLVAEATGGLAR